MGTALAAPHLAQHPVVATAFLAGNVLPDMDALSRVFGRRAFLASHQTWSHALPVIVLLGALGASVTWLTKFGGWSWPLWMAAGMVLHALLDYSNTFGITLLAPFSKKRMSVEWVFFIDAFVLTFTLFALAVYFWKTGPIATWAAVMAWVYPLGLVVYFASKGLLRMRAETCSAGDVRALIPSALIPWQYLGCREAQGRVETFTVNALSGQVTDGESIPTFDAEVIDQLEPLPEWRIMRHMSNCYHVVSLNDVETGRAFECRDLRTRNFGGSFGKIDGVITPEGEVKDLVFHV